MTYILDLNKTLPSETNRTKLPFKKYNEILPNNFYWSKIRLKTLKTCLDRNENLMIESNKRIKQHIDDIFEPVWSTTTSYDLRSIDYLPHCAVVCLNRDTTKVHIVFDALVYVDNEPSLNDILYSGMCMLSLLHDILLRFRIGKLPL